MSGPAGTMTPSFLTDEPVAVTEAVRGVILSTLGLLQGFEVIHLSPVQIGLILTEFVAISAVMSAVARARSVPASRVALTIGQADLIEVVRAENTG